MTRILLATHGGSSADGALRVATLLADRLHSPCETVAVVPPAPLVQGTYGPVFVPSWSPHNAFASDARTAVVAQFGRCGLAAPPSHWLADGAIVTAFGPAAPTIAELAGAAETAVLVVGLGSHLLADRTLGDETALRLAQIATVPVLAVPADADELPRRVAAAIDFSETSARAAETAASWLAPGGTLYLVHVVHGAASADAADRLAELARDLRVPDGVRVEPMLLEGTPARALLDFARHAHCQLITLGSHGYGAVKRLVLGSVASKLLRHAAQAVLVVPAGAVGPAVEAAGGAALEASASPA